MSETFASARVSTVGQKPEDQIMEIEATGFSVEPHRIVAGSVLILRVAPDSDTMWVLPVLGIAISLSWMMSLHSATGRLSAKHAVLLELESRLPFDFLKRENEEFNELRVVRRK